MKNAARLANPLYPRRTNAKGHPPIGGTLKRGFDILFALAALVLLAPFLMLIALLVKFSDGGSVLYGHRRIGRNGETFECLKFRTMVRNGEHVLAAHLRRDPAAR